MALLRRGFIAGIGALLAAPTIIRTPGLLMPVKPVNHAIYDPWRQIWTLKGKTVTMAEYVEWEIVGLSGAKRFPIPQGRIFRVGDVITRLT